MELPSWLPASMLYTTRFEAAHLKIEYFLAANFIPLNEEDWASKDDGYSAFRCESKIYIFRPTKPIEENP